MRILVIDDDKDIRNFLKKALKSECFEVDTAEDGEDGLYLACTNEYDLIILDNNLPKKDGRSVCREIRKDGKTTPIIMLSVLTEPLKKAELINMGADDYITKPFSFEELLARIRALLRRPKSLTKDVIKIGDLKIDIQGHTVYLKGKKIDLTVKEFMLLEYLARNKGKVVTRGTLLEHVWDMNAELFSNTIEVHISRLRGKINPSGTKKLIHAVPGRGYMIDAR